MFKSSIRSALSFFSKLNLVRKLILSYILILAIPAAVFGVYYFKSFKSGIEADTLAGSYRTISKAGEGIRQNIDLCNRAAQIAISNRELLEFISTRSSYDPEELHKFKLGAFTSFDRSLNDFDNVYHVRIFLANPAFPEMWPLICSEKRVMDSEWRRQVLDLKGQVLWRLNHADENVNTSVNTVNEEVISLYREMFNMNFEHAGILEVSVIAEKFFGDMYGQMENKNSFLCLISDKNRLILNKNNEFLKKEPY